MALSAIVAPTLAFSGPTLLPSRGSGVSMRAPGEIGVTPPLGVYDPLNLLKTPVTYPRRDYRRYQELEIKHGRIAMLATVGVITTEAGFRWPGYLSKSLDLKFADVPGEDQGGG
jgi:light-harvesting complex I chlorophyll a/b binding protein 1